MPSDRGWAAGFQLDWQTLIMTVGVILVMVGGFWTLAYIPIQTSLVDLKQQLMDLREADIRHMSSADNKFLTQREYEQNKVYMQRNIDHLTSDIANIRKDIQARRAEIATRQDFQNALNTTRVEFLSEVKRLDQATNDMMKRKEFEVWKSERDKTIAAIQDRQNRFTEALDSMYSKIMQQAPSYVVPRQ